jgi:hypothetical protein
MAVNISTVYSGEVLDQLLVRATTNNQLVAGGHIRVEPNIQKKFSIPRLKAGAMLQKRKAQPVSGDSKGDFTIDERYLEPQDLMAYTEFNPRSFEQFWRKWQPTGNLVFSELPAEAQNALLSEMAKVIDFELGEQFIIGVAGTGEDQFFNGILTRIVSDGDTVKLADVEAITEANIFSVLKSVKMNIPVELRKNPNLKIFMSQTDADIYDDALTAQTAKGANWTDSNPERYKGITIVPLAAVPKDVVFATVGSTDISSNLWAGVAIADDAEAILIGKVTNAGELYFFKMLMKADTNTAWGENVVLYDGRTQESA